VVEFKISRFSRFIQYIIVMKGLGVITIFSKDKSF